MRLRTAIALLSLMVADVAAAGVPQSISVQGVLRDNTGKLQSSMINVQVNFYDAQTGGHVLSSEPLVMGAQAVNGLFTVTINDAALAGKVYASTTGQVWLEISVGNDTYPRQQVTSTIFALACSNADSLGGVAASSYLTTNGNGGGLTNLNGANIQNGSIPKAAVGAWIEHTHSMGITRTGLNSFALYNSPGTTVTGCSPPCPSGTTVISGTCDVFGTSCNPDPTTWNIVATFIPYPWAGGTPANVFCCRGYEVNGGGTCNLNVTAICLNNATGTAP